MVVEPGLGPGTAAQRREHPGGRVGVLMRVMVGVPLNVGANVGAAVAPAGNLGGVAGETRLPATPASLMRANPTSTRNRAPSTARTKTKGPRLDFMAWPHAPCACE